MPAALIRDPKTAPVRSQQLDKMIESAKEQSKAVQETKDLVTKGINDIQDPRLAHQRFSQPPPPPVHPLGLGEIASSTVRSVVRCLLVPKVPQPRMYSNPFDMFLGQPRA